MPRMIALLAAVAALVAGAPAAQAAQPVVVEKNATVTRHFAGIPMCDGFTVTLHYDVRRTVTEYYDKSGDLTRVVLNIHYVGTWTNDETGESISNRGTRHITEDFVDQTTTETGALRHMTAPGEGIVLHETGRIVYDWNGTPDDFDDDFIAFIAGPHQDLEGDLTEVCAALGG